MRIAFQRWLRRGLWVFAGLTAVFLAVAGVALVQGWQAFGHRAEGARRARMEASPQWKDDRFVNPQPLRNDYWKMLSDMMDETPDARPVRPLPAGSGPEAGSAPVSGLRATWLGHSTVLVEIDGHRVLTDPVWSRRASPLGWAGPERWYAPPIALADLPPLDAVLISHDHYDHLDLQTVVALSGLAAERGWGTRFVVPLGVGAHLAYWGVPEDRIVELDWWDRARLGGSGGLEVVSTPARHASGRILVDNDRQLWTGFALLGAAHRVYYSGDTGLFPALTEIGERLGPFDLTMIEVGQYGQAWPDWHLGPEQAVQAHQMVRGRVMLPVHWGAFVLAYHGWTEPIERALAAGTAAGATLVAPRPGQSFEPAMPPPPERWWPDLPWRTGAEDPIVSNP